MGRVVPAHSFDHTRRSQRDIVVYNDIELRNVLGNVKRGSRVVIASKILVSRTININIVEDRSLIDTSQGIIISGFGTGRLEPKDGTEIPFNLFNVKPPPVIDPTVSPHEYLRVTPISIQYLNFSGFKHIVNIVENNSPTIEVQDLSIIGCSVEKCATLIGTEDVSVWPFAPYIRNSEITDNTLRPDEDNACALSVGIYYDQSNIRGNIIRPPTPAFVTVPESMTGGISRVTLSDNIMAGDIDITINQSTISDNIFYETTKFDGTLLPTPGLTLGVISGNRFLRVLGDGLHLVDIGATVVTGNEIASFTNDPSNTALVITNNRIGQTGGLLPNSENFVVRNNRPNNPAPAENAHDTINGAGRIVIGGEVLGQQVIDSPSTYFSCEVTADATADDWQQVSNDADTGQKPTVQFYVPCGTMNPTLPSEGKTVLIRLQIWARNAGPSNEMITIRITDVDSDTANNLPVTVHTPQGFRLVDNAANGLWQPMTFEWYINPSLHWDVGQQVQVWFQTNTDGNGLAPSYTLVGGHFQSFVAGTAAIDYGPIITSAIAVPENIVKISPSNP